MRNTTPRIGYLCNKCYEWFFHIDEKATKLCPDCKTGKLIKSCTRCVEDWDKCTCKNKGDEKS